MLNDDRGSATVWAALSGVVLCGVVAVLLGLGQVVSARHRAGGAADLSALAAADHALEGGDRACAAARRVAEAQDARLVRCDVSGEIADVSAQVRLGPYAPAVRARAGPPGVSPNREKEDQLAGGGEQLSQQPDSSALVQRVVAVAALGGLDAGRAAAPRTRRRRWPRGWR